MPALLVISSVNTKLNDLFPLAPCPIEGGAKMNDEASETSAGKNVMTNITDLHGLTMLRLASDSTSLPACAACKGGGKALMRDP